MAEFPDAGRRGGQDQPQVALASFTQAGRASCLIAKRGEDTLSLPAKRQKEKSINLTSTTVPSFSFGVPFAATVLPFRSLAGPSFLASLLVRYSETWSEMARDGPSNLLQFSIISIIRSADLPIREMTREDTLALTSKFWYYKIASRFESRCQKWPQKNF